MSILSIAITILIGLESLNVLTYRRDFEGGTILVATRQPTAISFDALHQDLATGETGATFTVPPGDGRVFTRVAP